MRRATSLDSAFIQRVIISIHALREESDHQIRCIRASGEISIHALREESDPVVWGIPLSPCFISIHALREESDTEQQTRIVELEPFQSTLSVRRATTPSHSSPSKAIFQSTLSVRRATRHPLHAIRPRGISIHALREESDFQLLNHATLLKISIHALREESDPSCFRGSCGRCLFQSTLSVRRATSWRFWWRVHCGISIHALREESDP